jgi:Mg-chelatase subunit ChlD
VPICSAPAQAAADESKATRKPLDLVLVIDRSWSMREDHKLDGVKQTVR